MNTPGEKDRYPSDEACLVRFDTLSQDSILSSYACPQPTVVDTSVQPRDDGAYRTRTVMEYCD